MVLHADNFELYASDILRRDLSRCSPSLRDHRFRSLFGLTDKDIATMTTDYSSRAVAGQIVFGTRRTKLLKAYVLWIQDFYRTSNVPIIVGLNEATFKFSS